MGITWSDKRVWIVAAILLVFTPLASLIFRIIGLLFSIIGFLLGLVNPLGLFVAFIIAAVLIYRKLEL
jgi:hypothetical protein